MCASLFYLNRKACVNKKLFFPMLTTKKGSLVQREPASVCEPEELFLGVI